MEQNEKQSIFRQTSLDRVSSPEELNSYIRVCTPPMWIVLLACILILAGAIIWATAGYILSTTKVASYVKNGECTCLVPSSMLEDIKVGDEVMVEDESYTIKEVSAQPVEITDEYPEYLLQVGELVSGQWVYEVKVDTPIEDGVYEAYIVDERVRPSSFLLGAEEE